MPDHREKPLPPGGNRLESYWLRRFEDSARSEGDAARNIGHTFGHQARRDVFLELVGGHLPPGARSVLDVGCGSGTYFDLYRRLGLRIQGLDFSAAQLAVARGRYPDARLETSELAAAPADLRADLVVCIGVVQVVSDLPGFIAALADRTNPGGRAVVSCLEQHSIWPGRILDPQLRFYSAKAMRRLFAPHFRECACRRFYPLPPPFSLLRPVLHRLQLPWLNHGMMFVLEPRKS